LGITQNPPGEEEFNWLNPIWALKKRGLKVKNKVNPEWFNGSNERILMWFNRNPNGLQPLG